MPRDPDKDVYRWMERRERKKKLKLYVALATAIVAAVLVWVLRRAHFIVVLSMPQIVAIVAILLALLAILFLI